MCSIGGVELEGGKQTHPLPPPPPPSFTYSAGLRACAIQLGFMFMFAYDNETPNTPWHGSCRVHSTHTSLASQLFPLCHFDFVLLLFFFLLLLLLLLFLLLLLLHLLLLLLYFLLLSLLLRRRRRHRRLSLLLFILLLPLLPAVYIGVPSRPKRTYGTHTNVCTSNKRNGVRSNMHSSFTYNGLRVVSFSSSIFIE